MEGGIRAWEGLVAEGYPESRMAFFSPATRPEEFIALAWYLEHGSQKFYSELTSKVEEEAQKPFQELMVAEGRHKATLFKLYSEMTGSISAAGFPESVISPGQTGEIMEGGIQVNDALQWVRGKKTKDILEFSISLEANSYDLYTLMERKMVDPKARKVFTDLSDEEKHHLDKLSALFEKTLPKK